ncbi:hypothetical protein JCM3770_000520 [Rhodotorula araucariae]
MPSDTHSGARTAPFPTLVIPGQESLLPSPPPSAHTSAPSPKPPTAHAPGPTNTTSRRAPSPSPSRSPAVPVRPTFMRVRQTSLPASLVQSRHYSLVGSSGLSASALGSAGTGPGTRRVSVASFASLGSFDSLPEEGEGDVHAEGLSVPSVRRALSPPASPRTSVASCVTLPPGGPYRAFSVVRPRTTSSSKRAQSPSSSEGKSAEERVRRAERRWRIAEEMRETEKAYVQVLEEIDEVYYRPLIEALPRDDPLSRRSSKRYSAGSAGDSSRSSPRQSLYDAAERSRSSTADSVVSSTPGGPSSGPILSRHEINQVFSNFIDVLNLAHVMLVALNEAVPLRPVQPVSISPSTSATSLPEAQVSRSAPVAGRESQSSSVLDLCGLSRSGGTDDSEGPGTPPDGSLLPRHISSESTARNRPLRTRSKRRDAASPAAPPLELGKVLLPILPFLRQYSLFVANFSSALTLLSRLDGSSTTVTPSAAQWQAFIAERQHLSEDRDQGTKIGLAGLLLNIIQRVPRYRLLLQDLLQYTEDDHPDARDLRSAFQLVDNVASHLDSQIQAHTNALAVLDLQRAFLPGSLLSAPLVAPGRALLRSGPFSQRSHTGFDKPRVLFLFTDTLLVAAAEDAWIDERTKYRLVGRYGLEDVTVIGSDWIDHEGKKRCGLDVLSSQRSFAIYADKHEDREAWLNAIRDATAALTSARATLQRSTPDEPLAALSSSNPLRDKAVRRTSFPPPATSPSSMKTALARSRSATGDQNAMPSAVHRQVSMPPSLAHIPPTPADELERLVFPLSPGEAGAEIVQSPLESSAHFGQDDGHDKVTSDVLDLAVPSQDPKAAISAAWSAPVPRPALARSRRWSDFPTPSSAFSALSSLLISLPSASDLATGETAYPVVEAYQAPVWVPDVRAPRCQRCKKGFGVWRRKHHCRLCGGVVCWECSTRQFIIPSLLLSSSASSSSPGSDRLARACDTCFASVFAPAAPASRFLASHPAATSNLPPSAAGGRLGCGSVKWTGTWRLSTAFAGEGGAGLEPLWDLEERAADAAATADPRDGKENTPTQASAGQLDGARRAKKRSAVHQLRSLVRE